MIDRAKLDQMLSNLEGCLGVLRSMARVPRAEFLANPDKVGNAKYHFVVAIECCIDIANHVIASQRFRLPRDNADCFVILVENGLVPERLREPLRGMARFRNRLVHVYWDIDDAAVHDYRQQSLHHIEDLARAVASAAC